MHGEQPARNICRYTWHGECGVIVEREEDGLVVVVRPVLMVVVIAVVVVG